MKVKKVNIVDGDSEPEKCYIDIQGDTRAEMHITNIEEMMHTTNFTKFTDESNALYPINESPEANLNHN